MPNISATEKEQRRLAILAALPSEQSDVAATTGLSVATVSRWIARMHKAGQIRIGSWRRHPSGGEPIPTYVSGPGEDATCSIKPMTNTERCRRARQRRRERTEEAVAAAAEAQAAATWSDVWGRLVRGAPVAAARPVSAAPASSEEFFKEKQLCLDIF
jgi:hypothetical protein